MHVRLFGADGGQPIYLLGADNLGRDLFSRIVYASRVSLFIGLIGVFISFIFGITLGGISGFFGGKIDMVIQRLVEFIFSIPQIPLWMALSAAIPQEWTGIQTFFAITVILSLVGWTGLAGVVAARSFAARRRLCHCGTDILGRRLVNYLPSPVARLHQLSCGTYNAGNSRHNSG